MAQDTQFRTDQFNEQARQASESRIGRSLEGMGQSIERFGDAYRDQANRDRTAETQAGQFAETMDLRRDQFALTKAKVAQDLYWQDQDNTRRNVDAAGRAMREELLRKEINEKIVALQQRTALGIDKHALESAQRRDSLAFHGAEKQEGVTWNPKTKTHDSTPKYQNSATGEGPQDVENWKTLSGRPFFNKEQGRWEAFHSKLGKSVGIPKEQAWSDIRILANQRERMRKADLQAEFDRLIERHDLFREDPDHPEAQAIRQKLQSLGSRQGAPGGRQQKPVGFMQGFNQGFESKKSDDVQLKSLVKKDILGSIGSIADPELRKSMQNLKKNAVNFEKWFKDQVLNQRKRKGVSDGRFDKQIAQGVLMGIANGVEMPGLIMKEGKKPNAVLGEHNGERFERSYRGRPVPSRDVPFAARGKADIYFDDAEAYDMIHVYGPAREKGLVIKDLNSIHSPSKSNASKAYMDAVRRLPADQRKGIFIPMSITYGRGADARRSRAAHEFWRNLSTEAKLGFGKYVQADPKFEEYLDFLDRTAKSPSALKREQLLREQRSYREQRIRKEK